MKKLFIGTIVLLALIGLHLETVQAISILSPQQGGTGISTSTGGNNNLCLIQVSANPLTYGFATCGSGGGGGGTATTTFAGVLGPTFTVATSGVGLSYSTTTGQFNLSWTNPGYILSAPATTTILAGGTATGNAFTFATSTSAGTWNINCTASTCTWTIPPQSDQYFAPSTTIATNNTQLVNGAGFVAVGSSSIWTALNQFKGGFQVYTSSSWFSMPPNSTSSALLNLGSSTQLTDSTSTFIGINTTSSWIGDFMNFQVNSSTKFSINSAGGVSSTNYTDTGITNALVWANAVGTFVATGTPAISFIAGSTALTNSLTIATSGPLESVNCTGSTCTFTSIPTSTILTGYASSAAVTAGSYTNVNLTVNGAGGITAIANGSAGAGSGNITAATSSDVAFYVGTGISTTTLIGTSSFTFAPGAVNATATILQGTTSSVACTGQIDEVQSSTFYYTYWKNGQIFFDSNTCQ